jgi:hypothetical protein
MFGSLAFLAFYRDWKVLVPATIVVALDHVAGVFWPQSVFGVVVPSQWRWVEHAAGSCSKTSFSPLHSLQHHRNEGDRQAWPRWSTPKRRWLNGCSPSGGMRVLSPSRRTAAETRGRRKRRRGPRAGSSILPSGTLLNATGQRAPAEEARDGAGES